MAAQQPPDVVDQTSKFKKRLSQHNLRVDIPSKEAVYAVPVQVSSATDPQCIAEGKELFSNFLQEEIEREGLQAPREIFTPIVSTPVGYRNPLWAKTGRELRMLADAFSKTKERERVRRRADEGLFQIAVGLMQATTPKWFTILATQELLWEKHRLTPLSLAMS